MRGFIPFFLYVFVFAVLPLVFTTVKTVSRKKLRDRVFVKTLAKDYLRILPACAIVSLPVLLAPSIMPYYAAILHLVFALALALELGHVYTFRTRVGLNTFYSLFVSNVRETREFFAQNITWKQDLLILALWFAPVPCLLKLPRVEVTSEWVRWGLVAAALALIAAFVKNLFRRPERRKDGYVMNPYTNLIYHWFLFRRNYRELKALIAAHTATPFTGITSRLPAGTRETHVIVIGESANSQHFPYCGYPRETTPFTDRLGNRMMRFKGVRSPFSQTIPSLEKTITFADAGHPDWVYTKGSVIDYFNDAGFETTWFSNQYALDDTALTAMTSHAKRSKCFNYSGMKRFEKAGLDGDMLNDIARYLAAPQPPRRVLFVHLIGSHSAYVNRYPDEFRHFEGPLPGRSLPQAKADLVNSYDDSLRYTDWVLAEIIKLLGQVDGVCTLLYFSDHGEDIYDSTDAKILGHSQLANLPMTSVPFMVWTNEAFDRLRADVRVRAKTPPKRYNLQDAIHTMLDLASLAGSEYDETRSIFGAPPLVLASASPRRAKILRDQGVAFAIVPTQAAEVAYPGDPVRTVRENALAKGAACAGARHVLSADTIVWFGNRIYGKPKDLDEAKTFLRELSGKTHSVFTGVAYDGDVKVVESRVTFRDLDEAAIDDYVARVKPTDRAGAYDIDESGDLIVAGWTGSYENIMGLPLEPLRAWGLIRG